MSRINDKFQPLWCHVCGDCVRDNEGFVQRDYAVHSKQCKEPGCAPNECVECVTCESGDEPCGPYDDELDYVFGPDGWRGR